MRCGRGSEKVRVFVILATAPWPRGGVLMLQDHLGEQTPRIATMRQKNKGDDVVFTTYSGRRITVSNSYYDSDYHDTETPSGS